MPFFDVVVVGLVVLADVDDVLVEEVLLVVVDGVVDVDVVVLVLVVVGVVVVEVDVLVVGVVVGVVVVVVVVVDVLVEVDVDVEVDGVLEVSWDCWLPPETLKKITASNKSEVILNDPLKQNHPNGFNQPTNMYFLHNGV